MYQYQQQRIIYCEKYGYYYIEYYEGARNLQKQVNIHLKV